MAKKRTPTVGDLVDTGAKAALSVIAPGSGELLSLLIGSPSERRRKRWIVELESRIQKLEEKFEGLQIDKLQENEQFVSAVLKASPMALRNHQEEKRQALLNAISNIALDRSPDEDEQSIFIEFIDSFTPWHLRMLKWLDDPDAWGQKHGVDYPRISAGGVATLLEIAFPELKGRRDFYDQLEKDLSIRGLTKTQGLHGMMTGRGLFERKTSEFGQRFLKFIESPIEDEE